MATVLTNQIYNTKNKHKESPKPKQTNTGLAASYEIQIGYRLGLFEQKQLEPNEERNMIYDEIKVYKRGKDGVSESRTSQFHKAQTPMIHI